jgi:hypothetical protein
VLAAEAMEATGISTGTAEGQPSAEAQVTKADFAPTEAAPQAPAQPQIDPIVQYLAQQNQVLQLQMQAQQAQMAEFMQSFKASLPKPPEVAKSEIDLFQEQTLSKAEQALLDKHIAPLRQELDSIKQREHQARVQSIAAQRMNEAAQAGRQAFAADLEHAPEAANAVQELVLTMMYGYEKPAAEAAQIANQVVEKILSARTKRLTAKAKADALAKPRAPVAASAQSVTAGGTGGVAGARPDWFFKG